MIDDRIGQQLGNYRLVDLLGTGALTNEVLLDHFGSDWTKVLSNKRSLADILKEQSAADILVQAIINNFRVSVQASPR